MPKYIVKAPTFSRSSMQVKWVILEEVDDYEEALEVAQDMLGADDEGKLDTIYSIPDDSEQEEEEPGDSGYNIFDSYEDMSQFSDEDI